MPSIGKYKGGRGMFRVTYTYTGTSPWIRLPISYVQYQITNPLFGQIVTYYTYYVKQYVIK